MTLQQLEAICSIARHRFSMSRAADVLQRSQSGLSRRIKELETELGTQIFLRTRNKIFGLTPQGERILRVGLRILQDVKTLEQIAGDEQADEGGEIRIATSHVHARYLLPGTVKMFTQRFPQVVLTLHQCDPVQCRDLIAAGDADVGISTVSTRAGDAIVSVPAFRLPRCLVVPAGHPLTRERTLTLEKIVRYPLITNPATFIGRSILQETFARAGLRPRIACSVTDADVCKTYVEIGLGVAVLSTLAFNPETDQGLVAIDATHLFRPGILNIVLRKHGHLTRSLESFLSVFAPHVQRESVQRMLDGAENEHANTAWQLPVAKGMGREALRNARGNER